MAILQSALVEPLLSRQQSAVMRNIACATQLNEALKGILSLKEIVSRANNYVVRPYELDPLIDYLSAEIIRVLMQIKIPADKAGASKSSTNAPGKVPGTSTN